MIFESQIWYLEVTETSMYFNKILLFVYYEFHYEYGRQWKYKEPQITTKF